MSFKPKVSIIIPVYNGSNYLAQAIDSALSQTYKNIEVIVVNDGSTDQGATEKIANSYGDRIRYFYKENGGVATALNYGISMAQGEYISWLSHDDKYKPNKVEVQINYLSEVKEKNGIVLYSDYCVINAESKVINTVINYDIPQEHLFRRLFLDGPIHGCTTLIPISCFDKVGPFNTALKTVQDYEMWYRLMKQYSFYHVPEVLVESRLHDDQGHKTMSDIHLSEYMNLLEWWINDITVKDILRLKPRSISLWYLKVALDFKKTGYFKVSGQATKLAVKYLSRNNLFLLFLELICLSKVKMWSNWVSPDRYKKLLVKLRG